jgi:hypothetical protein
MAGGPGDETVHLSGSNINLGAGAGTNLVFIRDGANDSFVLHSNGTDVISGFSLASRHALDLRTLLSEANLSLNGDMARLGSYVHVANANGTARVSFDPTGTWVTPGSPVAVLQDVGTSVTSVGDLISGGGIRIS